MSPGKFVVVVDAYSSGNQVSPVLQARGFEVVHLRSMAEPSSALLATYIAEDFVEDTWVEGDPAAFAAAFEARRGKPAAVILGTETGADLCDALAAALGVPGNPPATSALRKNKYEMIEALHAAGLPAARQCKAGDVDELVAWFRNAGLDQVVVKPVESAGADNVRRCTSEDEVRAAAESILGATNQMGGENDAVLIQEFLAGHEFVVNTVSCAGRHHVCEIWDYTKVHLHGRDFVYDYSDLVVDGGASPAVELGEYVFRALDALGFEYGPGHAEVMLTERGPVLVEIGPRLQGMASYGVNDQGIGYSPLGLTVDAYLDPAAFMATIGPPYRSTVLSRRVAVRAYQRGKLKAIQQPERISDLESCVYLRWIKSPGDTLKPTVDFFSIPGVLVLVHEDPAVIERDYQAIRRIERDGLFELE